MPVNEMWRPVDESPTYHVSNKGRVRGPSGKILKPRYDRSGYSRVSLYGGVSKGRQRAVHRLVATAFISPRPSGHEINHRDCVRDNNAVENLEWITKQGNSDHRKKFGKRCIGEDQHAAKLTFAKVEEIRRLYSIGVKRVDLAKQYGVHVSNIYGIISRRNWNH